MFGRQQPSVRGNKSARISGYSRTGSERGGRILGENCYRHSPGD